MKLYFFVLICATLLMTENPFLAQADEDKFDPVYAIVLVDRLNVRAGHGLNFENIGRLNKNDQVVVVGQKYGWHKINLPNQALCFVHQDYIDPVKEEALIANKKTTGVVKANKLRVRAGKGLNFNVLGILTKGEKVKIVEQDGVWLRIRPPKNCFGWVKKDYLQLSQKAFIPQELKIKETGTQKQTKKVSETPPPPAAVENKIEVCGTIDDLGKIFKRRATHKLLEGKKILYYLKSLDLDLNRYVYKKVHIIGEFEDVQDSPYPVIKVEEIKIEQ